MSLEDALWKLKAGSRGKRRKRSSADFDLPLEYDPRLISLVSEHSPIDANSTLSTVVNAVISYVTASKLVCGCQIRLDDKLSSLLREPIGKLIPIQSILSHLIKTGCIRQKTSS